MMTFHLKVSAAGSLELANGMGERRAAHIPSTGIGRVPTMKVRVFFLFVKVVKEVWRIRRVA